jgi:WD40 repeat protein
MKMAKIRIIALAATVLFVLIVGYLTSLYARGYRMNEGSLKVSANGLLVIKSDPDGAQVFVNGELKTATNANIALPPGSYDVQVQKEGYLTWNKRLVVEKEIVTESTAHLFKSAPSLSAITFSSSLSPVPSKDLTKIAYIVPPNANGNGTDTIGLWILEMLNLPLGFSREPKRITDGDLTGATIEWSPDNREILLTTPNSVFLLPTGDFTPQAQRVNVSATKKQILAEWKKEQEKRLKAQVDKLPDELKDIFERKVSSVAFSPDEDMIVYTASSSATIADNLKKQLPGASTQKQERQIKPGSTYIYDIKEDRNFLIDSDSEIKIVGNWKLDTRDSKQSLAWFPTSRHLVLAKTGEVIIMDYDGTNRQTVYPGSYVAPHAFPTLSNDRLIILTNLGATSTPTNLYSLSIK